MNRHVTAQLKGHDKEWTYGWFSHGYGLACIFHNTRTHDQRFDLCNEGSPVD